MVNVLATKDAIQETDGNLEMPEIRVWCCPYRRVPVGSGNDYYRVFKTFKSAYDFIKKHPEAERQPLIAYKGWELNLDDIEEIINKKKESFK